MSDNMKKFGLEFVLENRSQQAFSQIMDQQKRLEKQLNANVKAFNKFQSAVNNTSLENSIKKMDKLTNSVKRYNDALAGSKGSVGTISGSSSGLVKDFMTADYLRDSIGRMSSTITSAFDSLPFGQLYSGFLSNAFDGIATSIATGNIAPAIIGAIQGGVESAMAVYRTSSEFVHSAIYSAFQKGSQLIVGAITTLVPQTLDRELNQTKLSAVLGNDTLAKQLSATATKHAQTSALSLQDMDFILPNLVMANKSSGVTDARMQKMTELEMEAVKRLNFKDAGKGAGVQGSLMALQEMLSGDMISLQRRFEIGGAAIDRIEAAGKHSPEKMVEQLIKELESMGVTEEALNKVQESTKSKMDRITETVTDFFTNPTTGIIASLIEPFGPAVDNIINFLETGGGGSGVFSYDDKGLTGQLTVLENITLQFKQVFGKIGEIGLKLGESFFSGFVSQVDWSALWVETSGLLDTVSTYFTPAFEILAGWVNSEFIPWVGRINDLLQKDEVRKGIQDYIKGLTDIATRSLDMVETIIEKMPTISKVTTAVNDFLKTVQKVVDMISGAIQSALNTLTSGKLGQREVQEKIQPSSNKQGKPGKAVGMAYVPRDGYEAILHKGERVLTAQQNRQYNQGLNNVSIPKLADTIIIREEADITKIANTLVRKLNENKLVYVGGAY